MFIQPRVPSDVLGTLAILFAWVQMLNLTFTILQAKFNLWWDFLRLNRICSFFLKHFSLLLEMNCGRGKSLDVGDAFDLSNLLATKLATTCTATDKETSAFSAAAMGERIQSCWELRRQIRKEATGKETFRAEVESSRVSQDFLQINTVFRYNCQ